MRKCIMHTMLTRLYGYTIQSSTSLTRTLFSLCMIFTLATVLIGCTESPQGSEHGDGRSSESHNAIAWGIKPRCARTSTQPTAVPASRGSPTRIHPLSWRGGNYAPSTSRGISVGSDGAHRKKVDHDMALGKAFDRTFLNVRERPLSGDPNQDSSNSDYTARELLQRTFAYRDGASTSTASILTEGFISDSFKADVGAGMTVVLRPGIGWQQAPGDEPTNIDSANNLNDQHPLKPLVLDAAQSVGFNNADPTNPRIDSVFVKYDRQVLNPQSRDILDTSSGVFTPNLVLKDLVFDLATLVSIDGSEPINVVTGSPNVSPVAPATPAGYMRVCDVWIPAASSSITANNIGDRRRLLVDGGSVIVAGHIYIDLTTYLIDQASSEINAPPGVDVVVELFSTTDLFGSITIMGPFPIWAAPYATTFKQMKLGMSAGAEDSSFDPVFGNPIIAEHGGVNSGAVSFGTGGASSVYPTSPPLAGGQVNQNAGQIVFGLVQWDGSGFSKPTTRGSGTLMHFSFVVAIPVG